MKEEIKLLLQFLKKPTSGFVKDRKVKKFFSILILDIEITALVFGILSLLENIDAVKNGIVHKADNFDSIVLIVAALFFAPIIEEFIFRYFLVYKRFNPLRIFIKNKPNFSNEFAYTEEKSIDEQWNLILPYAFYTSAILFGLLHLTNYEFNTVVLLLSPLLIMVQLNLGLLAGYLRVRINFGSAVLLHIIHNAIFVSVTLLGGDIQMKNNLYEIFNEIKGEYRIINQENIMQTMEYRLSIKLVEKKDAVNRHSYEFVDSAYNIKKLEVKECDYEYMHRILKEMQNNKILESDVSFLNNYKDNRKISIEYQTLDTVRIHSMDTVVKYLKLTLDDKGIKSKNGVEE